MGSARAEHLGLTQPRERKRKPTRGSCPGELKCRLLEQRPRDWSRGLVCSRSVYRVSGYRKQTGSSQ